MNKDKTLKAIIFILLTLLVGIFIIKVCPVLLQNDTLYDIKLGHRYLSTGMFAIDDYSFHVGLVYQTHHYLVCIIDYLVYDLFSLEGLYYLEVLLLSIVALLFYFLNKTLLKNKFLIYVLLFFQLIALSPFVSLRAQMYNYIIFMLEIFVIEKYLNTSKKQYAVILGLLPLVLINLHSGVIYFYFIIIFTYLMNFFKIKIMRIINDERSTREHLKILVLCTVVGGFLTLLNPYGIDGITYGLKTLNSYYISNYITEFQSFNILTPLGILIALYIGMCIVGMVFSKRKIKIQEIILLLGTTFMTLLSTRHFSLFIITSVVIFPHIEDAYKRIDASNWSLFNSLKKGLNPMNIIVISFYIVMVCYFLLNIIVRDNSQLPKDKYPIDATDYIRQNIPADAHIFNQYEWGSYLMFNNIKTYIDPRCDLFNKEYNHGTTVMKDYIDIMDNNKEYQYVITKYNIDYFLLSKTTTLAKKIVSDAKYEIVYSDNISIIIKVSK